MQKFETILIEFCDLNLQFWEEMRCMTKFEKCYQSTYFTIFVENGPSTFEQRNKHQ